MNISCPGQEQKKENVSPENVVFSNWIISIINRKFFTELLYEKDTFLFSILQMFFFNVNASSETFYVLISWEALKLDQNNYKKCSWRQGTPSGNVTG